MLRTVENYRTDCDLDKFKLTGIKKYSVWNDLQQFHVVNNRSADSLRLIICCRRLIFWYTTDTGVKCESFFWLSI